MMGKVGAWVACVWNMAIQFLTSVGGISCVRDYLGQFLPGGRRGQYLHPSGLSRALLCTELTDTSTGHLVTLPPAIPTSHLRPVLLVRVN